SDEIIERVEVSVNGTVVETIMWDGARVLPWSADWTPTMTGTYTLFATMWDSAGAASSEAITIYVDEAPEPPQMVTLTMTADGGTVSSVPAGIDCGSTCSAMFEVGIDVTLTAVPDVGMKFVGWSGDEVSTANPLVVTLAADEQLTAMFEPENSTKPNLIFLPLVAR
ncbi:MAG: hypothetical protein AAF485_13070, partial [Chloroflexota bacterium]